MLDQLISSLTPDVIMQVIKTNPSLAISVIQKSKSFELLSNCLSEEQQMFLSKNFSLINPFLEGMSGHTAISNWVNEFTSYVNNLNKSEADIRKEIEAKVRAELEAEYRKK